MGSLISHLVFTPPKKHIEQDPEIEGDEILTTFKAVKSRSNQ